MEWEWADVRIELRYNSGGVLGVVSAESAITVLISAQFASFDPAKVKSTPQVRTDLFRRKLDQVLLTDFFGSVRNIELLNQTSAGSEGEERSKEEGEVEVTPAARHSEASFPHGHYLSPQDSLVRWGGQYMIIVIISLCTENSCGGSGFKGQQ